MTKFNEESGTLHLFLTHGLNFFELLKLGKVLGHKMSEVGGIYGREIGDDISFGQRLSPELNKKIDLITEKIIKDINSCLTERNIEKES